MTYRVLLPLLLVGLAAGTAHAQNRAPVQATRRDPTERVSPLPGVTLPTGVGQDKMEEVPPPLPVKPNGSLPLPRLPQGSISAGPVDSGRIQPATPQPAPTPKPQTRRARPTGR